MDGRDDMLNFLRRIKRKINVFCIYLKWLSEDNTAYWGNHDTGIPLEDMDALVRALYPDVLAFFSTPEGKKQFIEWKAKKEAKEKAEKLQTKTG